MDSRLRSALRTLIDNVRTGSYESTGQAIDEAEKLLETMMDKKDEKPKVPFYYSNEHDQGMGVPARCRCGGSLALKPLGWTCSACRTGYGRDD